MGNAEETEDSLNYDEEGLPRRKRRYVARHECQSKNFTMALRSRSTWVIRRIQKVKYVQVIHKNKTKISKKHLTAGGGFFHIQFF